MNTRRALYWLAFFAVVGIIAVIPEYFFAPESEPLAVQVQATSERGQLAALQSNELPKTAARAEAELVNVPQTDLFAARSWYVAPARQTYVQRPVAPPTPSRPVAPPLPFKFIGKLADSERLTVFLQRGDAVHVVGVGDVIDNIYQVERIDATEMTLVYLPLQMTQSLAVGSAL